MQSLDIFFVDQEAVEQTVELTIRYAMTLMWRHCDEVTTD